MDLKKTYIIAEAGVNHNGDIKFTNTLLGPDGGYMYIKSGGDIYFNTNNLY